MAALLPRPAVGPASPFLTADEAAELLRCRKRRVYELVADGRLTRHADGRRLLVKRAEVVKLARGTVTPTARSRFPSGVPTRTGT